LNDLNKKKRPSKEKNIKEQAKIHYDADSETDVFDFYEDEEPFKEIQVT